MDITYTSSNSVMDIKSNHDTISDTVVESHVNNDTELDANYNKGVNTQLDIKTKLDDSTKENLQSKKYLEEENLKWQRFQKRCEECNVSFLYRRHFDRHMEGHKNNDCKYCDARITSKKALVRHLKEVHLMVNVNQPLFKCEYCNSCFVKRTTLYNHYNNHANGRHVCTKCGKFIDTLFEYAAHMKKHEQTKIWKCQQCNESFYRRQQYLYHLKSHDKYKCQVCDEKFCTKLKVADHELMFHNLRREIRQKSSWCNACNKKLPHNEFLSCSCMKCCGKRKMRCSLCNSVFSSIKAFTSHFSTAHSKEEFTALQEKICSCVFCNKIFTDKLALQRHVKCMHVKEKKVFNCENCDYSTRKRDNFMRHMAHHANKKEYVCEECGVGFNSVNNLKDHHVYRHTETRLYACDLCDKSFKRNCELNRHMQAHSEVRPFKCHCGAAYKRSSHLQRHKMVSHSDTEKQLKTLPDPVEAPEKKTDIDDNLNWINLHDEIQTILGKSSGELITLHKVELDDVISPLPENTFLSSATQISKVPYNIELPSELLMLPSAESESLLEPYTLSFDLPHRNDDICISGEEQMDQESLKFLVDTTEESEIQLTDGSLSLSPLYYPSVDTSVTQ